MADGALVAIVMGSASDEDEMAGCGQLLERLGIPYEQHVMSAHRTPDAVREFCLGAADAGFEVLIAAAGGAAALPGVAAAYSPLPVIGVPIASSPLNGVDALYAIAQMPPGVPVAADEYRQLGGAATPPSTRRASSRSRTRRSQRRWRRIVRSRRGASRA